MVSNLLRVVRIQQILKIMAAWILKDLAAIMYKEISLFRRTVSGFLEKWLPNCGWGGASSWVICIFPAEKIIISESAQDKTFPAKKFYQFSSRQIYFSFVFTKILRSGLWQVAKFSVRQQVDRELRKAGNCWAMVFLLCTQVI